MVAGEVGVTGKDRFARHPIAVALATMMLTVGYAAEAPAADMELWAPPGGNVVIKDSTGSILRMLVNGTTGEVRIPQLPNADFFGTATCFGSDGTLGRCSMTSIGATGARGPRAPRAPRALAELER